VGGGLFFAFWLAALTAAGGIHGKPGIQDDRYVLVDHGAVTVIDKTTYERALINEERGGLGVLGGFGVSGTMICAASVARAQGERSRLLGC
jgi:hypothetical protein